VPNDFPTCAKEGKHMGGTQINTKESEENESFVLIYCMLNTKNASMKLESLILVRFCSSVGVSVVPMCPRPADGHLKQP
jgi:hypothetical protein